jgi:hypothetical protein
VSYFKAEASEVIFCAFLQFGSGIRLGLYAATMVSRLGFHADPDSICAFQQYSSVEASEDFLRTSSYAAYLKDVEPLLADAPQVTALTPMWSKGA